MVGVILLSSNNLSQSQFIQMIHWENYKLINVICWFIVWCGKTFFTKLEEKLHTLQRVFAGSGSLNNGQLAKFSNIQVESGPKRVKKRPDMPESHTKPNLET